ncbi:MAG: sigma-70 family RNA polymerase sigma factor [Elusimicrobia bacterium]|nr:sigma-70 family RNA polymerase sigma factor [Elusimicrobiota bacterium]
MEFKKVLEEFYPKLRGIARKFNGYLQFVDEDDLLQEMSIYLLEKWEQDKFKGKTESYLMQGCWFHIKNYLRTVNDKVNIVSIDEPINSDGTTLNEIIPDNSQLLSEIIAYKIYIKIVKANGLTKREKEVLVFCLNGYTLREIGNKLKISFVRVARIRKNICKKWSSKMN